MSDIPPCLYRSIRGEEAINNHLEGILWLRSPAYFQDVPSVAGDSLEGIGSHETDGILHRDVGDSTPIQPAFVLSFSADVDATRKFGDFYFVLQDPAELESRIKNALPPSITEVTWRKIEYTKTMQVDHIPTPSEDWDRKYFN